MIIYERHKLSRQKALGKLSEFISSDYFRQYDFYSDSHIKSDFLHIMPSHISLGGLAPYLELLIDQVSKAKDILEERLNMYLRLTPSTDIRKRVGLADETRFVLECYLARITGREWHFCFEVTASEDNISYDEEKQNYDRLIAEVKKEFGCKRTAEH